MANRTSIKSPKVAKKSAAKRVAAKPRKLEAAKPRKLEAAKPRKPEPMLAKPRKLEAAKPRKTAAKAKPQSGKSAKPALLAGGNPQIAKGDGDAPVEAYIAAMPGWKRDVGRRLDALITRTVPDVRKAVKWNSPFYGIEDKSWFLSFHCFAKYVKVAFFRGASLAPVPPGCSTTKHTRYLNIHEDDEIDEAQFTAWVKQVSELPGEKM
jgi:hypothetical protein